MAKMASKKETVFVFTKKSKRPTRGGADDEDCMGGPTCCVGETDPIGLEPIVAGKGVRTAKQCYDACNLDEWFETKLKLPHNRQRVTPEFVASVQRTCVSPGKIVRNSFGQPDLKYRTIMEKIVISPDGSRLAVNSGATLTVFKIERDTTFIKEAAFSLDQSKVTDVAFSNTTPMMLAIAGNDAVPKVFQLANYAPLMGRWTPIAAASNLPTRPPLTTRPTTLIIDARICSVAFSPDGRWLAYGFRGFGKKWDNTVKVFDTVAFGLVKTLQIGRLAITPNEDRPPFQASPDAASLAFSPDGTMLLAGCNFNIACCWNTTTWEQVYRMQSMELSGTGMDFMMSVAYTPDGKTAAATTSSLGMCFWDAADGGNRRTLEGVYNAAFSPEGSVVTVHEESLRLWNVESLVSMDTVPLDQTDDSVITSVAVDPSGKYAVTGLSDGTLQSWPLVRKRRRRSQAGGTPQVPKIIQRKGRTTSACHPVRA